MSVAHQFSVEHAKLYGLRESILIHNLHFWISHNHANGTHSHDGRTWTYNSIKAFEDLFPYLTYKQIRTSLETLVTLDVLVRGYYSANPADRSSWYAFTDQFLIDNPLPERKTAAKKKPAPSAQQGTPSAQEGKCPSAQQGTPSAQEGKSLIGQIVNTDVNILPAAPTALPTAAEVLPAKAKRASKPKADDALDTELQAACRATWKAYTTAYRTRYGVEPVRNAKVNANIKAFMGRVPHAEAPGIASFYVRNVSEAFVVRSCHPIGALLQNAEAYRTQWATGQAMTNTRAQQADKTQSNFDAAQGAKAMMAAKFRGAAQC